MHTSHFASLLQPRYTLILALALGLPLFQQLGGINIVIFYSADILAHCGISSPVLCTVLIGGTNFAVSLASSSLTDVWGRKALWVTSHAICGVSLLVLSITIMVAGAHTLPGDPALCRLAPRPGCPMHGFRKGGRMHLGYRTLRPGTLCQPAGTLW